MNHPFIISNPPPLLRPPADPECGLLIEFAEDLDQLCSTEARGLSPAADRALDLAWYYAEDEIRERTGLCTAGHRLAGTTHPHPAPPAQQGFCACCHHYNELRPKAERLRSQL